MKRAVMAMIGDTAISSSAEKSKSVMRLAVRRNQD